MVPTEIPRFMMFNCCIPDHGYPLASPSCDQEALTGLPHRGIVLYRGHTGCIGNTALAAAAIVAVAGQQLQQYLWLALH